MASPTIQTLTSFSGADLVATFANVVVGELMQISWAVQRDKAPIFTFGSPDARSFSRGKRGLAGSMTFAVFDHDSLVSALQSVWDEIAPPAMFTAAANRALAANEDFSNALDLINWNKTVSDTAAGNSGSEYYQGDINSGDRTGWGFSYGSSSNTNYTTAINAQTAKASNNRPDTRDVRKISSNNVTWSDAEEDIYVPAGFAPIRGENVIYADTLPPFDITLTFASEYGHTAFQKIYDVDILNESSGVSIDTVLIQRQLTWIARRLSPLIRGVYTREGSDGIAGKVIGKDVYPADSTVSNVVGG